MIIRPLILFLLLLDIGACSFEQFIVIGLYYLHINFMHPTFAKFMSKKGE